MNSTLAIDLSSSFSTSSKNNGVQIQNIDKGPCPNFDYIRFWTDLAANTVYAYGGEFSVLNPWIGSTTVPLESLWSFTPSSDGGIWQSLDQSSSVFDSITRPCEDEACAVTVIPHLNRSVFNTGNVNSRRSSYNLTERRVRNQVLKSAYSRSFSEYVNSPIRRNVAKARQKAAYNITPDRDDLSRSGRI